MFRVVYMEKEAIVLLSDKELAQSFNGDSFAMYMKEVFRYRLLSVDENKELARRYRDGDQLALEKLINHNLRLVVSIAYKYRDFITSSSILDVIQEGNLGLMRAAKSYDPEIAAFSTYANWWIHQAISRNIGDIENEIRVPVYVRVLNGKYLKLMNNNANLSDVEICKELSISKDTLDIIRHTLSLSVISLNQPVNEDEKAELGDLIESDQGGFEDVIERMSSNSLFVALKESLSDVEYFILFRRQLSDRKLTLEEVGNEFGLTRERVRQLEAKALKKSRELLENDTEIHQLLAKVCKRENCRLDRLRIEPRDPKKIIKFLYIKDKLNVDEKRLLYFIYFGNINYTQKELSVLLNLELDEFTILYRRLKNKLKKYFVDNFKFEQFRERWIKEYGTKIYSIDLTSDIKVIDYRYLKNKYSSLSLDMFLELVNRAEYELNNDELALVTSFYSIPERKYISADSLFRDLNLAVFGYKDRNSNVPINKLWIAYKNNINEFSEEQRMFLECFFFNKRKKSEFIKKYKDSSLFRSHYFLIDRLERIYFNIHRFSEYNFDLSQYIKFRSKHLDKLSRERIELLDLFYGVNGVVLSIQEIAELYNVDYVKMHDKISTARNAAILINAGFSRGLDIDKKVYIPYLLDSAYSFPDEHRVVLKLFFIENKSYEEISNILGLTKYRISNIITEDIRKMDAYRFGLIDVFRISKEEIETVFAYYKDVFSDEEKSVLIKKYLNFIDNKEIADSLGLELLQVNRYVAHFNKLYNAYKVRDVELTVDDILMDINRHVSESTLDYRKKVVLSFYYGFKTIYNPEGIKLKQAEIISKFKLTKNSYYQIIHSASIELKCRKIGLSKPTGLYIDRDKLNKLLDDSHLPISDKEREIICYLFELKGYPYKTIDELVDVFGDNRASIGRRYQRAIVSIYKYINNEIEGKLDYEVDWLPNLKYFSYSDRNIINKYFRDGLTVEEMAKEYGVSYDKMFSLIEKIKVNMFDILNNPKAKKFDFDYYMSVRNNKDLLFYGDRDKTIEMFDLYYGMNDDLKLYIPDIIKKLNLDVDHGTVSKAINNLMLSICKYSEGIKNVNNFNYDDIMEYYVRNCSFMTRYKKQCYVKYFQKISNEYRINGAIPGISDVILYDLLVDRNPFVYTHSNLNRDIVVRLLKTYGHLINNSKRRELMALYEISSREFMSGKDINHVYRIINFVDEKLKEKGTVFQLRKKD